MTKLIKNIRGMNDLLPEQVSAWQQLLQPISKLLESYGLQEIRTPLLEETALFARGVGQATDIVEKEMFTMHSQDGESISLRPEGTAGTIRLAIQHGLTYNQEQRLYYFGQMYRYERPQKGRYRQFHQVGVEILGIKSPYLDAEIIQLSSDIWRILGISEHLTLELNTIGSSSERAEFGKALVAYFTEHYDLLDEHSKNRLNANPLRILDSKDPQVQELANNAPKLMDYISEENKEYFAQLCKILEDLGINYKLNPKLVRGLDYYNDTVFEWTTDKLGAQATCLGGGRYDNLVTVLGGKPTPGFGFAMGFERLLLLVQETNPGFFKQPAQKIVVISDQQSVVPAMQTANQIRSLTELAVIHLNDSYNFKKLFQKANKLNALLVVIVSNQGTQIEIKNMNNGQQIEITDLTSQLTEILNSPGTNNV